MEIPLDEAENIAHELSTCLDFHHAWYADFKNNMHHYIIFRDKVFYIERTSKEQYEEARAYGIALGIPEYQVAFVPTIT